MRIIQLLFFLFFVNYSIAQQTQYVDFLTCKAEVYPLPIKKEVKGNVSYTFKVNKNVDSVYIDAKKMTFDNVY